MDEVTLLKQKDKYRGCMVGGAIGDALGYPVEFMSYKEILKKYGEQGITDYKLQAGYARVSDDTQMTMYTANSLLYAYTRIMVRGIGAPLFTYAKNAYTEWYNTQRYKNPDDVINHMKGRCCQTTWISNVPEMYAVRAPGNTCLEAIEGGCKGTVENKINDSKGCGGVMRVAPIGLFGATVRWSGEKAMHEAADFAAITHTHELGYISAAAFAYIINQIVVRPESRLENIIIDTIDMFQRIYRDNEHTVEQIRLIHKALELAKQNGNDHDNIVSIGRGWVGEEALAIAVYCALKYSYSFEDAIIAAVNHGGDSDSTGAICGNIMGAYVGFNAIPPKYIGKLELLGELLVLADDLVVCADMDLDEYGNDELWMDKYCKCVYPKR